MRGVSDDQLIAVLDPRAGVRRRALERLGDDPTEVYLLRSAMLLDRDATVRERAAERLARVVSARRRAGAEVSRAFAMWFEDACRDVSASVRLAAYRGLSRARDAASVGHLRTACVHEPVWSVRRAAVVALAVTAAEHDRRGEADARSLRGQVAEMAGTLVAVLDDPFWRVRHAAARALSALGARRESARGSAGGFERSVVREVVRDAVDGSRNMTTWAVAALAWVRRSWTGEADAILEPGPRPEPPRLADGRVDPLWDPDPAVVSARLDDSQARPSRPLLLMALADSHESLRKAAIARLRALGDIRAIKAALSWLDEPRIPHASASVRAVLDSLGDDARALAGEILADEELADAAGGFGDGARAWALSWVGDTECTELAGRVFGWTDCDHGGTRAAAARALGQLAASPQVTFAGSGDVLGDYPVRAVAALVRLLGDGDDRVHRAAVEALARIHRRDAAAALAQMAFADQSVVVQRMLVDVAIRTADADWLRVMVDASLASGDAGDAGAAAQALVGLVHLGELGSELRRRCRDHADPWLRAAVLDDESAWVALDDRDPQVRRAAFACLERALPVARQRELGMDRHVDRDPWLRTRAALLLSADSRPQLCALLTLSADSRPAVRAAAAERLCACANLDHELRALLGEADVGERVRMSAYSWLAREFDDEAGRYLAAAARAGDESETVVKHIASILGVLPGAPPDLIEPAGIARTLAEKSPATAQMRGSPPSAMSAMTPAVVARRSLGQTGIDIAPLIVSGAHELGRDSLRAACRAGVDAFFWEPHHRALGEFLRTPPISRERLRIVSGSFHGSPEAVEADVDRALRKLGTDYLDVFLLFWARSATRLGDELRESMRQLVQRGKVRAIGFSTHDRALARAAARAGTGGWDVVMTRHNAAHTGAEREVFPAAQAAGMGALTFSALCYGQMLRRLPDAGDMAPPSAADCYRYSLSQAGVSACITAPRRHAELMHNLAVLDRPTLSAEQRSAVRAYGRLVYRRNKDFNALIRREPRAAFLAREQLSAVLDDAFDSHLPDKLDGEVAPEEYF